MKKAGKIWQGMKLNTKFTLVILLFVLIPIACFSLYFFQNMEGNTIREKEKAMEYTLDRSYDQIKKNVDSINMSTQFFLSDQALQSLLVKVKEGDSFTTAELREFYSVNIASLERMVNNNPYLYQIRVYADSDSIQEMMPILYRKSRMEKLDWSSDVELSGWKYDYTDTIFDTYALNQSRKLMSLVTPVTDYEHGLLGTIEVAMYMDTMFGQDGTDSSGYQNCFIDENGVFHLQGTEEEYQEIVNQVMEDIQEETEGQQKETQVYSMEYRNISYVVGYMPIKELSGNMVSITSLESEIGNLTRLRNQFLLIIFIIFIFLTIVIHFVVRGVLHQFYDILYSIREVQRGDLDVVIQNCGTDEMGELGTQINKMLGHIKQLMEDNLNRELLAKNSEIKALQNQINAHFIYNVLESIKMMAEIDEKYEISDAITTLGKLLRYGMRWVPGNVTVAEEIEYIKNYLLLMNLRFDYEIYLAIHMPDIIYQQEIPKMSLQPIIENAIYHGIEEMAEDTSIYLKGTVEGNDCLIEITDSGKGMTQENLEKLRQKISGEIEASGGSGNGIGLKNVQDRIQLSFGTGYGIEVASKLDCYTKIIIRIPLKR